MVAAGPGSLDAARDGRCPKPVTEGEVDREQVLNCIAVLIRSWPSIDRHHDAVLIVGDLDQRREAVAQPGPDHPCIAPVGPDDDDDSLVDGFERAAPGPRGLATGIVLRDESVEIQQVRLGVLTGCHAG